MTLQECIDRTIEQRDKFAALPEESISLDLYFGFRRGMMEQPAPKKHTTCNSVGCLWGWVQFDLAERKILKHYHAQTEPMEYLGVAQYRTPTGDILFYTAQEGTMAPRDEGLKRYHDRLHELYTLQRTSQSAKERS